jgi:hypothetical protein
MTESASRAFGLQRQTREPPTIFAEFHRPLRLGLSIGHPSGTVGTIGPFVRLATGQLGLIGASFVLAPKGNEIGHWIHQPGPLDAPILTGITRIGRVVKIAASAANEPARVASAAVELVDTATLGNVVPDGVPDAGRKILRAADPDDISVGDEVACVACTSGYSSGRITTVQIDNLQVGQFSFSGAFGVVGTGGREFSHAGDAGALIYRRSDMAALGLVVARSTAEGSEPLTLALPLLPALRPLMPNWLLSEAELVSVP